MLLVVLGSACEVRATVDVVVEEDGSGTVEVAVGLDADALAQVPDLDGDGRSGAADLSALVRTEDLEAAGWEVSEPSEAGSDLTWIRVSKPFGTPEEANAILAEVTGPEGPLRDLRLERSTGFAATELTFTGTADLSGGLEAFGDAGLVEALDGEPLGEDVAQIEERIGGPVADAVRLDVTVDLPGGLDANTDDRDGGAARWTPRLGDAAQPMEATGSVRDMPVLLLTGVAVATGIALVVLAVLRFLPRGPAPAPASAPASVGGGPEPAGSAGGSAGAAPGASGAEESAAAGGGGREASEPDVPGWHHPPPVPSEDAGETDDADEADGADDADGAGGSPPGP